MPSKIRLSKKSREQLSQIISNLKRGRDFLREDKVLICVRTTSNQATTSLHYQNSKLDTCFPINKEVGSELALLHAGIRQLEDLFDEK